MLLGVFFSNQDLSIYTVSFKNGVLVLYPKVVDCSLSDY